MSDRIPVPRRILEVSRCPFCRGRLADSKEGPHCADCRAELSVREGIVVLRDDVTLPPPGPDLSVLLLTLNEGPNLRRLLPAIREILDDLDLRFEVVVMDGGSADDTAEVAETYGARLLRQSRPGYANAYREGIAACTGERVLTMDADMSHDPGLARVLWRERLGNDLVIGSRYVEGGGADTVWLRKHLSRILNEIFRLVTGSRIGDLSSGYRLFRRAVLRSIPLVGRDFDVVVEASSEIAMRDYAIAEVPMYYKPRGAGVSKVRLGRFARSYIRLAWRVFCNRVATTLQAGPRHLPLYGSALDAARLDLVRSLLGGTEEGLLLVGEPPQSLVRAYPAAVVCASSEVVLNRARRSSGLLVDARLDALPFHDRSFDHVVWYDTGGVPAGLGEEVRRVVRDGGRVLRIDARVPTPLIVQLPIVRGVAPSWSIGGVETLTLHA